MLILLNLIIGGILMFCYVEVEIFEMYLLPWFLYGKSVHTVHPTSEFLVFSHGNQEPAVKVTTYLSTRINLAKLKNDN